MQYIIDICAIPTALFIGVGLATLPLTERFTKKIEMKILNMLARL